MVILLIGVMGIINITSLKGEAASDLSFFVVYASKTVDNYHMWSAGIVTSQKLSNIQVSTEDPYSKAGYVGNYLGDDLLLLAQLDSGGKEVRLPFWISFNGDNHTYELRWSFITNSGKIIRTHSSIQNNLESTEPASSIICAVCCLGIIGIIIVIIVIAVNASKQKKGQLSIPPQPQYNYQQPLYQTPIPNQYTPVSPTIQVSDPAPFPQLSECPYCNNVLNFPTTPRYCPYCNNQLLI